MCAQCQVEIQHIERGKALWGWCGMSIYYLGDKHICIANKSHLGPHETPCGMLITKEEAQESRRQWLCDVALWSIIVATCLYLIWQVWIR